MENLVMQRRSQYTIRMIDIGFDKNHEINYNSFDRKLQSL